MIIATGGCLCGRVSYELDQEGIADTIHCHCTDCQKATGAGKATIIAIPVEHLKLQGTMKYFSVKGTDGLTIERGFCETCGSPIIGRAIGADDLENIRFVKAGILDNSSWLKVQKTIWKSSARPWDMANEEIPCFEKNIS